VFGSHGVVESGGMEQGDGSVSATSSDSTRFEPIRGVIKNIATRTADNEVAGTSEHFILPSSENGAAAHVLELRFSMRGRNARLRFLRLRTAACRGSSE
jgi:hypothetical protein